MISTGFPQRLCTDPTALHPVYDFVASQDNNNIINYADDTTVSGLISTGRRQYKAEVAGLKAWCKEKNLYLNTDKTKKMIIDLTKRMMQHIAVYIEETEVQRVKPFKFSEDLTWSQT